MAVVELDGIPGAWQPRAHPQLIRFEPQAEKRLDDQAVHPASGTCVPAPAAPADMRRHGVDVGGHDVGLDLIHIRIRQIRRVTDRIEQREQFPRPLGFAHFRERHDGPDRPVGVLAAVLPNAGRVAFDVAGFERGFVEGRIE